MIEITSKVNLVQVLFSELEKNNINYAVLRNYENLPNDLNAKDIDIVIDRSDTVNVRKVFNRIQKNVNVVCYTKNTCAYLDGYTVFFENEKKLVSVKFDFFYGFDFKGLIVWPSNLLLQKKRKYNEIFVIDQNYETVMLWLHPLMSGKKIKEKYIPRVIQGFNEEEEVVSKVIKETLGTSIGQMCINAIKSNNFKETLKYRKLIIGFLARKNLAKNPFKSVTNIFRHYLIEGRKKLFPSKAKFMCMLGPDGVGKTTFIEEFRNQLSELTLLDIENVEVRHFRPSVFPNLKKVISGKNYNEKEEKFTDPHRAKPVGSFSSFLRLVYYWLDYVLGYQLIVKRDLRKGKIVIFDRYFYDFIVDPYRSRINLPLWIRMLFLKLTPQPSSVYLLTNDVDIIYQRKQELTKEEIQRQLSMYDWLYKSNKRFQKIDSRNKPSLMSEEAIKKWLASTGS